MPRKSEPIQISADEPGTHSDVRRVESHPAYGVVTLRRITGHTKLAGVTAPNLGTFFRLTVHEATRLLNEGGAARPWPDKMLLEIALSPAQYVRLITNTNTMIGSMCTIQSVHEGEHGLGERPAIERCPETDPARLQRETEEKLRGLTEDARMAHSKIKALLNKGNKMKSADRDQIGALVGTLMRNFDPSNVSFAIRMLQEAAEKVVTEAQTEADAAIQTMLQDLGERALAAGAKPALPDGVVHKLLTADGANPEPPE